MMDTRDGPGQDEQVLGDYLRLFWRRKEVILALVFVTAAVAYVVASRQQPEYRADAQVLLTRQDLVATVTGIEDPTSSQQPDRLVQTLAELARVPAVAQRAVTGAHVRGMTADELLASSSVTPKTDADVLAFSVKNSDPRIASRLATAYAKQFEMYRRQLEAGSIAAAQAKIDRQLQASGAAGQGAAGASSDLLAKSEQLQTLAALERANANVVRSAGDAAKVSPRPGRDALIAACVGLLLGIGLLLLAETFDTRVRTVAELRERLGLPILAQVPPVAGRATSDELVMLERSWSADAEPYRILRANLDLLGVARDAKTIMFVSAEGGEGKSTTIANLALALARGGRKVALLDGDLRRPSLHRRFGLKSSPGLANVLLGGSTVDEALQRVEIGDGQPASHVAASNGSARVAGTLDVLPGGPSPIGEEILGRQVVGDLVSELRGRYDVILVDAPPILSFGDALALSSWIDHMIVVVRLGAVRRQDVEELRRVLESSPAEPAGAVATGVRGADLGSYRDDNRNAATEPEPLLARTAKP
jgi:capsular exopolysaccharide synthesis family protein